MLIAAFIYPLFGKKNYYCHYVCPCGALQFFLGKIKKKKWKLSLKMTRTLERFRKILWTILSIMMLFGIGFSWIEYEIFTSFILTSASYIVIIQLIIVCILSLFIPQPYCRFFCPTGSLLKFAQNSN